MGEANVTVRLNRSHTPWPIDPFRMLPGAPLTARHILIVTDLPLSPAHGGEEGEIHKRNLAQHNTMHSQDNF